MFRAVNGTAGGVERKVLETSCGRALLQRAAENWDFRGECEPSLASRRSGLEGGHCVSDSMEEAVRTPSRLVLAVGLGQVCCLLLTVTGENESLDGPGRSRSRRPKLANSKLCHQVQHCNTPEQEWGRCSRLHFFRTRMSSPSLSPPPLV